VPNTPRRTVALNLDAWRKACKARGLVTPGQVAEALGLSRQHVWRVEEGTSAPGPEFMAAVLNHFARPGDATAWHRFFRVVQPRRPHV